MGKKKEVAKKKKKMSQSQKVFIVIQRVAHNFLIERKLFDIYNQRITMEKK